MAAREAYLAIDFGTSNVHATVIDAETTETIIGTSKKYAWYTPALDQIELDAAETWEASEWAVGQLMKQLPEDVHLIALTFSYFGDNITPVDEKGEPLYRMLPGFCGRSRKQVEEIGRVIGQDEYARITGNTLSTLATPSKIMWMRDNHPEIFKKTAAYFTNQQFVMHKLGLGNVQDTTMAARKLAYDVKGDHWSQPILDLAGVTAEQLGTEIVESATVVGHITSYGSVKLPEKLPVTIGCHDVSASLLSAGVAIENSDTLGVLMGTYEQLGYFSDTFIDGCNDFGDSLIFSCCYNSPFKGKYTVMDAFPTAGAMLEWYCRNILDDPSADMGELIAKVPLDGKNRVLFLPYVENFHGAVAGMSLSTTRQDLFESLLESLAFQFVHCIEYIQSTSPIKFEKLHFGGGGSRSDKLLQLRADLIGQPLGRMHNIELPSLGACMLAGIGNGFYKDVPDAAKHLVGKATYFMPDAENGKRYHQKYEQYKALSAAYLRGF